MSKLDQAGLKAAAIAALNAQEDPSGEADLVYDKGKVVVCADPNDFKAAFKRLKKMDGFKWIVINRDDVFGANTLSIGSKAGILDAKGSVLKEAALPRKSV